MILALAVLMVQPSALPAPSSVNDVTEVVAPVVMTDDASSTATAANDPKDAEATNVQVNPAIASLPLQRSFSGGVMILMQSAPAPMKDEKAAQKSAPAPASEPVFQTVTMQPGPTTWQGDDVSYVPGQVELTRVPGPATGDESSSRAESGSTSSGTPAGFTPTGFAPASYRPARYSPISESGRMHGLPRKWLMLSAVEHGAATFDAWSTRRVIMNGTGYEMNPMLKPFANSNALYGAVQVAPLAFDYLSLRMLHSEHGWMRRMWWVPQSASTAASLFGGVHNSMLH